MNTLRAPGSPVLELHVFGIRRSGNHAVIGWLCDTAEDVGNKVEHFNDIHDRHTIPPKIPVAGIDHNPKPGTDLAIYSYQDVSANEISEVPFYSAHRSSRAMMIFRSLENLIASRLAMYDDLDKRGYSHRSVRGISMDEVVGMWETYARAFLDLDERVVCFDAWFQSRRYRDAVFRSLGIGENTDSGVEKVRDFGFGSSFDHQRFDGAASDMDVLGRGAEFHDDPRFEQVLSKHPEAVRLNKDVMARVKDLI